MFIKNQIHHDVRPRRGRMFFFDFSPYLPDMVTKVQRTAYIYSSNQQREIGAAHRNINKPITIMYRTTHPVDITNSAFASKLWEINITVRCTLCLYHLVFLQILSVRCTSFVFSTFSPHFDN
jgi:hypothetical protein